MGRTCQIKSTYWFFSFCCKEKNLNQPVWLIQETALSFFNSQQLKLWICLNFMLSCFPSVGANRVLWRLMSTVLAWPIVCHLGLGVLRQSVVWCIARGAVSPAWGILASYPIHPISMASELSRSESLCRCVLQTRGSHKTELDLLLFKARTLTLDLLPLSPSTKYLV